MGRREEPLDQDGPLYEFAAGLRELRAGAGSPPYRELARLAHVSQSALSAAASGRGLPTWEVTAAYVRACGHDPQGWRPRWEERHSFLRATDPGMLAGDQCPPESPGPAPATAAPPHESTTSPPLLVRAAPALSRLERLGHRDPRRIGGFRVLARLGEGAMGVVYLAASPAGRPVAVKVVRPQFARDPVFRRRFAHELAAARKVAGGHSPAVLGADAHAPAPWLATAFVPGPSLAHVVDADGPLPEPVVWGLAAGIAEALAAIHAAGIVHRDLKPANILLDRDGPKVIDFGICRALDATSLTTIGMRVGTAGYTAPEQAEHGASLPAGDVFALGAVLAYAATGIAPFGTGPDTEVLYRIVHEPPAPGALACTDKKLRALIESCLAKDPADRPDPAQILELAGAADPPTAVPSLIAARAAARDAQATDLLARARTTRRVRVGLAPLLLILAIATISAITLRTGTTTLDTNPPPVGVPASTPQDTIASPTTTGLPENTPQASVDQQPSAPPVATPTPPPDTTPATAALAPAPGPVVPHQLAAPDFNGYCQATGHGGAYLTQNTVDGWACSSPNASVSQDAQSVCAWTNHTTQVTDRIADFNDPNSWQCWAAQGELGPLNWNTYCRDKGYPGAQDLGLNDAYTWVCAGSDGSALDAQDACAVLYDSTPPISRFQDFTDKNSWQCWG